eukprot:TRINITY_DN3460_c0_g1_i4.p1 TRINITY_DN3460_c0_g1~~TRINITY_DN3460_c0_g1_i4.p1  ORF type:complete len:283 (-),score=50.63 TRINITY_DN3460_c0_g1_i4:95-943(-)
MHRYDDSISRRINESGPLTIYEMIKGIDEEPTVQTKPNVYSTQSRTMNAAIARPSPSHSGQSNLPPRYPSEYRQDQPRPDFGRPEFGHSDFGRSELNRSDFGRPSFQEHQRGFAPSFGGREDTYVEFKPFPTAEFQPPNLKMVPPETHLPIQFPQFERPRQEPPKRPEEVIKRNIDMLGGIESSIDNFEGSLRENELRNYNFNMKYSESGANTNQQFFDPSQSHTRVKLESASPLRKTYVYEQDVGSGYQRTGPSQPVPGSFNQQSRQLRNERESLLTRYNS